MSYHFRRHYTRDEARALLPQVKQWLKQLGQLRERLRRYTERISPLLAEGADVGGENVHRSLETLADIQDILKEFNLREIQIKDLERGLIDFPALRGGKEVFLCWELDEEDIGFWHDLTTGYSGREKL